MCDADAPPPPPPPREPEMLVNPFDDLDNEERAAQASRRGTSSLRVPLNTGLAIGFSGRGGSSSPTKASPTQSTGLAIGGTTGASKSAGYQPFASTAGLGHTAQQTQQRRDKELVSSLMIAMV
jgi:hypothetical protein